VIDTLVTDAGIDPAVRTATEAADVEVIVADRQ
jgi:hypothetical protein